MLHNIMYIMLSYINNKEYAASGLIKPEVKILYYVYDYSRVQNTINR